MYTYDIYLCIEVCKCCSDMCTLCTLASAVDCAGVPLGFRRVYDFLS